MTRLAAMISYHGVTSISARRFDYKDAPVIFELEAGDWKAGFGEITLYLEDDVLSDRIVKAINALVSSRKAELEQEPPRDVNYDCDPIADQRMDASDFEEATS